MSKVSVVIPAFNSAAYIRETINSVLNQSFKDLEVVVVDDGSKDNTGELLKDYHSKVRYILKENGGPASARNLGIKEAKGEFIAFLDADDLWMSDKLEKQLERFNGEDIGLVFSSVQKMDKDNHDLPDYVNRERFEGRVFEKLFNKNFVPTSTVLVRKSCFEEFGVFDEDPELISVEDYDMWLRIASKYKLAHVDEKLVRYRVHENNISKNLARSYFGEIKVLEANKKRFVQKYPQIENAWVPRLAKVYYELAIDYFATNQFPEARKYLKESLKLKPFNPKAWGYYLSACFGKGWVDLIRTLKGKR
ncbi:MAG: glycosyltransferase [Candidatus Omnitrophica bacterium]|nr:glycosyltransferase [Candidatus Omnitrophota bacterium]